MRSCLALEEPPLATQATAPLPLLQRATLRSPVSWSQRENQRAYGKANMKLSSERERIHKCRFASRQFRARFLIQELHWGFITKHCYHVENAVSPLAVRSTLILNNL